MSKRTRNEEIFRNITSKDGSVSANLPAKIGMRITRYCMEKNINRTRFIEQCCSEKLDVLEKEMLQEKSKDELIAIILQG